MKHTKGPWFKDGHFIRQVDDSGLIAELYISPNSNDGRNQSLTDNARLIAAAPEMLEALEAVLNRLDKDWPSFHGDVKETLKNAIKKARGES